LTLQDSHFPWCKTTSYYNFNFQGEAQQKTRVPIHLDAANLGDLPARYVIPALKSHEFPAVGVYVDPRIVPGFRYRVRPIQDQVNFSKAY
jgi:hypothetical protein